MSVSNRTTYFIFTWRRNTWIKGEIFIQSDHSIFPSLKTFKFSWSYAYIFPLKKSLSCCRAHLLLKKKKNYIILFMEFLLQFHWFFLCKLCQILSRSSVFVSEFLKNFYFSFVFSPSLKDKIPILQVWKLHSDWKRLCFLFILKPFSFLYFYILRCPVT